LTSVILGLVVNYLNPNGISLIREETKLEWAEDSLFINEIPDSISVPEDSTTKVSEANEVLQQKETANNEVVVEKQKESIPLPPPAESNKTEEKKLLEEEVVAFSSPKAIKLEQAYSLFNKGILFIDARDEADYLAGHITNAINIPFDDFDNHKQKLESISKNKPVVIYCAGTECDLSILLGNLMFDEGYKQVYIFFGGWNEWLDANYPVKHSLESNQE